MNTDINKFREELHKREVEFSYTKKNGEERTALGTLNFDIMGEENKPKGTGRVTPDTVINYYDLDSEGWRSFLIENFIGFKDD